MENSKQLNRSEDDTELQYNQDSSQECIITTELVESEEETDNRTNDVDIMANTQQTFELPKISKRSNNKPKGKGMGKKSANHQRKIVETLGFMIWLKDFWDNEHTIKLMGQFLTKLRDYCYRNNEHKMLKIVRPMKEVFKAIIIDMEKQKQSLKSISWDLFEQWALNAGLYTMYTNCHQMVWETDFEETLFRIFGEIYSQDAQEGSEISEDEECSLLPSIKTTSTLSTTVRTEEDPADVDICDISVNTRPRTKKTVKFSSPPGHRSSEVLTSKLKMSSKKFNTDSEKRPAKRRISSDTEEEELVLTVKKPMKSNNPPPVEENNTDSDASDNLEGLLDGVVQQQSLRLTTGAISQNISVKHLDQLVILKSRGERGLKVVKLEIYSDCLRKPKTEWWKSAEFRGTFLSYGAESRVQKLTNQLKTEAYKQVAKTKDVEMETLHWITLKRKKAN
ncbi:unnamed protein product [Arctia plantaginis]|uniref:Uncharacterized protein n=1 Tax=Arctia plantaginis TaxID=874455 RepID=A0A8S0ZJI7_ARCPL|nr:unnamed protein product [Arctia plantaginis]CAB3237594.1 unnamed protein product [Arctia plantaginis]